MDAIREEQSDMASLKTPIHLGVVAAAAVVTSVSRALDVQCPPDLGDVQIDGTVLVAAPCQLDQTEVQGDVRVFAGGSVLADGADIRGNVEAQTADFVILRDSVVGGDVQLEDMVGDASSVVLSEIDGNVRLTENRSRLEIDDNRVDGNLEAESNTGGILFTDNVIDGNLMCRRNDPAPSGGGNRVSGREQGQCANLILDGAAPAPDGGGAIDDPAQPGGDIVLDRQPSGGGSAVGLFEAASLALLWVVARLARRRR